MGGRKCWNLSNKAAKVFSEKGFEGFKGWKFYGQSLLLLLQNRKRGNCFGKNSMECMSVYKSRILCLRSNLEENFDSRSIKKKGWPLANACNLCKAKKESVDHVLLHCTKIKILWHLLFSLFKGKRMMSTTNRKKLLSWHCTIRGKNHMKVWRATPLCLFSTI